MNNNLDKLKTLYSKINNTPTQLKYPRRTFRSINGKRIDIKEPDNIRSRTMQKIKSNDTLIEMLIKNELENHNLIFTKPEFIIGNIEGKPDFIIPKYNIAIFCDGDFWHEKINKNITRDIEVTECLTQSGWKVFRFWEHEIYKNVHKCIEQIRQYIKNRVNNIEKDYKFTFVDLFSGIGGFRIPLKSLGGKCLGFSEIDKQAIHTYKLNYIDPLLNDEIELGDITKLDELPFKNIDLIVGGVPCQSWSVAGKMRGFDDHRGKLWEDSIRLVRLNQPKAFIFENVKGLIDPRNKENLNLIINSLDKAGYNVVPPKLLNSYDFGIPQNRDRIFIVGFRKDIKTYNQFKYPTPLKINSSIKEILNLDKIKKIEKKKLSPVKIHGTKIPKARNRFQVDDELNDFFIFCDTRNGHTTIHSWDLIKTTNRDKEICITILKNRRKKKFGSADGNPLTYENLKDLIIDLKEAELHRLIEKNILRFIPEKGYEFVNSKNSSGINNIYRVFLPNSKIFSTLTATGTKDMIALKSIEGDDPISYKEKFLKEIYRKKKYRPINRKEAGKFQGFPDTFAVHHNDKIAKKQFGNSVSIPVVYHLSKKIINIGMFDNE